MLGKNHFYHRTIRKVVVAFGTIFNDIQLVRYTKDLSQEKERFRVPLSYGPKEKYLTRITSDPNLTKSVATVVPRLSFEMSGLSYDSSRKQASFTRNFSANNSTRLNSQFVPIPYNFDFSLSIYTRNTEDGTQILEQILPFFTPDFNVTVNFIPSMSQKYDLPIILNSVNTTTDYEGDMMSTRLITWDLEFTAKGYIWPLVESSSYIRQANTNIYITDNTNNPQDVTVLDENNEQNNYNGTANTGIVTESKLTPNPIDALPDDEFGFSEEIIKQNEPEAIIMLTEDGYELLTEDSKYTLTLES